jgi:hypothetical protein
MYGDNGAQKGASVMKKHEFESFSPTQEVPLAVSFLEAARGFGYTSVVPFTYWDFCILDKESKPSVVLKTLKRNLTDKFLETVLVEKAPLKVALIEKPKIAPGSVAEHGLFLASMGAGVYARGVGWLLLPGQPNVQTVQHLQLKLAPRWRHDPERGWLKTCTSCGKDYGPEGFYKSAYPTARDPYRNICIDCLLGRGKK